MSSQEIGMAFFILNSKLQCKFSEGEWNGNAIVCP